MTCRQLTNSPTTRKTSNGDHSQQEENMRDERRGEWTTSRCLRTLRPFKAKITALRAHCESGVPLAGAPVSKKEGSEEKEDGDDSDDGRHDVSMDRSLNLEEHVISYKKSKKSYKRRKVVDPPYDAFDVPAEIQEEKAFRALPLEEIQKNGSAWKQLSEIIDILKQLFTQHFENTPLRQLRLLCAFKLGLFIGKQDREIRNLQEQLSGSQDITTFYEYPHAQLCRKWVMMGHALGYLITYCPFIAEALPQLLMWSREYGLTHSLFELFIETRYDLELDKYGTYQKIAHSINYTKLDEMMLRRMAIEGETLPTEHIEMIIALLKSQHTKHYTKCLTVIAKLVNQKCIQMASSHSLVETIYNIQEDQLETIELVSLFAQIIHLRNSNNIEFLTSCFHSCKRGYRSLIPSLRVFKSFLAHTPPPVIPPSNKIMLRTIFKPSYKVTPLFVRYTVKSDTHLALRPKSTNTTTYQRSKISTGDLI